MFNWFKKRQPPKVPPSELHSLQNELIDLFRAHDLETSTFQDWLVVYNNLPGLRGEYQISRLDAQSTILQLDLELRLSAERSILEHYAGVGDNMRQAIGDGLFKFCCGTFHVFLSAFWNHHEPDQVEIERWTIGGVSWDAYVGNMINTSSTGQSPGLAEGYMKSAQALLCDQNFTTEDHWFSFFFFNFNGENTVDCRLDNEPWPEMNTCMAGLDWPQADGFYSQRHFVLLRPAKV